MVGVFAVITCGVGAILGLPVWIVSLIFMIQGTIAATKGELYRYPMTLRLVK